MAVPWRWRRLLPSRCQPFEEGNRRCGRVVRRESGAKNCQPFIHLERAELARLEGDTETRVRELREAHRLFTAMGATGQAESISRLLSAVSPQPEE